MEHSQASTSAFSQLEFRRKLSRDPDNSFDKLSSDGKVLVSSLRTALEEAKFRIVRLRGENDQKDDIIEEERNHRIALEQKMEKYLVDLYQNPSVNDELRHRLPRAKKKGLLFQRQPDEDHDAESESSDVELMGPSDNTSMQAAGSLHQSKTESHSQTDQPVGDAMTSALANGQLSSAQVNNNNNYTIPIAHSGQTTATCPTTGGVNPAFPTNPQQQQQQQQVPAFPHYVPLYPPSYPLHFQPLPPLASSSMTSLASSSYMGLPSVTTNIQETQDNNSAQQERHYTEPKSADQNLDGHQNTRQSVPTQLSANNSHTYAGFSHPDGTANFNIEGQQQQQQATVPPLNLNIPMVPLSLFSPGYIPTKEERQDNVSHLTQLLQEMSVLKMENRELKTELKEHKRDLELLKLNTDDNGEKTTDAIYALIEEVKQAEKGGERAVSQLIQSANQDRNAALHELDRFRLKTAKRSLTASSNSQTEESNVDEAEDENDFVDSTLASDSENLHSETDELRLTSLRLEKLLERQKEITKQQIAVVTAERDEALDKVNKMRKKFVSLKASEFPTATHQNLQAKLTITEKERDIAVRKLQLLSQDMNEVTLMYNLQKALLTDDVNIHSNANPASSKWANTNNNKENRDHTHTADILEKGDEDEKEKPVSKLEAQVKSLRSQNTEKDKRIEKLEALVVRQRKKLNTLCAGPLLMED